MLGCSLSTVNVLVIDGSMLLPVTSSDTVRVITSDGSANSTMNNEKGGIPLNDGFVKLRLTVSGSMFVTLRFIGSLGGAKIKMCLLYKKLCMHALVPPLTST